MCHKHQIVCNCSPWWPNLWQRATNEIGISHRGARGIASFPVPGLPLPLVCSAKSMNHISYRYVSSSTQLYFFLLFALRVETVVFEGRSNATEQRRKAIISEAIIFSASLSFLVSFVVAMHLYFRSMVATERRVPQDTTKGASASSG